MQLSAQQALELEDHAEFKRNTNKIYRDLIYEK